MFTARNVKYLHITGGSLVAFAVLPLVLAYLFRVLLAAKIPARFYLPFPGILLDNKRELIAGLWLLPVARAFHHGYETQKENEMTL